MTPSPPKRRIRPKQTPMRIRLLEDQEAPGKVKAIFTFAKATSHRVAISTVTRHHLLQRQGL